VNSEPAVQAKEPMRGNLIRFSDVVIMIGKLLVRLPAHTLSQNGRDGNQGGIKVALCTQVGQPRNGAASVRYAHTTIEVVITVRAL
jgi:hypothetical protein